MRERDKCALMSENNLKVIGLLKNTQYPVVFFIGLKFMMN